MMDRQSDGQTETDGRMGKNNMSPDPSGGDIKITDNPSFCETLNFKLLAFFCDCTGRFAVLFFHIAAHILPVKPDNTLIQFKNYAICQAIRQLIFLH